MNCIITNLEIRAKKFNFQKVTHVTTAQIFISTEELVCHNSLNICLLYMVLFHLNTPREIEKCFC